MIINMAVISDLAIHVRETTEEATAVVVAVAVAIVVVEITTDRHHAIAIQTMTIDQTAEQTDLVTVVDSVTHGTERLTPVLECIVSPFRDTRERNNPTGQLLLSLARFASNSLSTRFDFRGHSR